MTQEDLAGLVGASRERVNKALAMFTRLGWVEVTGRSRYHILDREQLELRARTLRASSQSSSRRLAGSSSGTPRNAQHAVPTRRPRRRRGAPGRSASCTKPWSAPS